MELAELATLAFIDLPLCGARASEKLGDILFDPAHPLAPRLRPDLLAQLGADLELVRAHLLAHHDVKGASVALLAWGLGAELIRELEPEAGFSPHICVATLEQALDGARKQLR